jgi:hypothetical protein
MHLDSAHNVCLCGSWLANAILVVQLLSMVQTTRSSCALTGRNQFLQGTPRLSRIEGEPDRQTDRQAQSQGQQCAEDKSENGRNAVQPPVHALADATQVERAVFSPGVSGSS